MKNKIQIAAAIIVFGIAAGGYFLYDFMSGELVTLTRAKEAKEKELITLQTEYTQLQSFATNIQAIKQEFKELNVQLQAALEYMPRTFSLSSLLRKMTMVADNSGIEMLNFKPKTEETKDGPFYAGLEIDFNLKGTYAQTLVFFDQLSRLKRIVNIQSIRVAVSSNSTSKYGATLADSSVSIKTYRFTE